MFYRSSNVKRSQAQILSSLIAAQQFAAAAPALAEASGFATYSHPIHNATLIHNFAQPQAAGQAYNAGVAQSLARSTSLPLSFGVGLATLPSVTHNSFNQHQELLARVTPTLAASKASLSFTAPVSNGSIQPIQMDLASAAGSIILDASSLKNGVDATALVGGAKVTFHAGDHVTAAELVAISQSQSRGGQSIKLDSEGRAIGGTFSLNSLAVPSSYDVTSIVIPTNVRAIDKLSVDTSLKLSGDLVNNGSIIELGRNAATGSAASSISALDIVNSSTGTIRATGSGLNLSLNAIDNFTNQGQISSGGNLTVTAGGALSNLGGSIKSTGDVNLQSPAIVNSGVIASKTGDINLGSPSPDAELNVNNAGGTLSAVQGTINVRESNYEGTANTTISGGDLLSRQVNLNAGNGLTTVNVGELTGTVNSSGNAVHVQADTKTLTLGDQNLTGDPTYYNNGTILINGDISVQENLAIIASGDVATIGLASKIVAQDASGKGYNISIIAGADIGSAGTPPFISLPSASPATSSVSISGASATGGSVDFRGGIGNFVIDSSSSLANTAGGNILIAAFDSSAGGHSTGNVLLLPGTNLNAAGNAASNGNITVIAGGGNSTSAAIQLGSISSGNAAGANNIQLLNFQPKISSGAALIFDTAGNITSGNTLVPDYTKPGLGAVSVGNLNGTGSMNIYAGSDVNLNGSIVTNNGLTVASQGNITVNYSISTGQALNLVAAGNVGLGKVSTVSLATNNTVGNGGNLNVLAGAAFTENVSQVVVSGASATGGNIDFSSISSINTNTASNNKSSGAVNFGAYAAGGQNGQILINQSSTLRTAPDTLLQTTAAVTLVAGATSGTAIMAPSINTGNGFSVGSINLYAAQPQAVNLAISSGGISTLTGGTLTLGDIDLSGVTLTSLFSPVNICTAGNITGQAQLSGAFLGIQMLGNNIQLPGVSSGTVVPTYFVNASGNLNIASNITGDYLVFAAKGNINISGAPNVQANNGLTLVAGGDVLTSGNPSTTTLGLTGLGIGQSYMLVAAGAAYTSSFVPGVNGFNVAIKGASATGGSIDFNTSAINALSVSGANNVPGVDVTMIAYAGPSTGGYVLIPTGVAIDTGNGVGNGNVTIVAGRGIGAAAATALNISTTSGSSSGGQVSLSVSTPVSVSVSDSQSSITGTPLGGALANGSIFYNSINAGGADVSLAQGANLTLNSNIVTSGGLYGVSGGNLIVQNNLTNTNVSLVAKGNITLPASIAAPGGIFILAGGDVTNGSAGGASYSTATNSASQNAGNIIIGAGAAFSLAGSGAGLVATVTGPSSTGGSITFTGSTTTNAIDASASGDDSSAGNVTMFAYDNASQSKGSIVLASDSSILAYGSSTYGATGNSGTVTLVAGASAQYAIAIMINNVDVTNSASGGVIGLYAANPTATVENPVSFSSLAQTTAGNVADTSNMTLKPGLIQFNVLSASGNASDGGNVDIRTGGIVQGNVISVSGSGTDYVTSGTVNIQVGSTGTTAVVRDLNVGNNAVGTNYIGAIYASGNGGTGINGGSVTIVNVGTSTDNNNVVTNANVVFGGGVFISGTAGSTNAGTLDIQTTGNIDFGSASSLTGISSANSNVGATINLTAADITWDSKGTGGVFNIDSTGAIQGGAINIAVTGSKTQTIASTTGLNLTAQNGGSIIFAANSAALAVDGSGLNVSYLTGSGHGGNIDLTGNGFTLVGGATSTTLSAVAGQVGSGGTITITDNKNELLNLSSTGVNIKFDVSPGTTGVGLVGQIQVNTAGDLQFNAAQILSSASSVSGYGGVVTLNAGGALTTNGNFDLSAPASGGIGGQLFLTSGKSVTVNGNVDVSGAGTGMGGRIYAEVDNSGPATFNGNLTDNSFSSSLSYVSLNAAGITVNGDIVASGSGVLLQSTGSLLVTGQINTNSVTNQQTSGVNLSAKSSDTFVVGGSNMTNGVGSISVEGTSSSAAGGVIISTAGGLTIDSSKLSVGDGVTSGNGGSLSLYVGGPLLVNGDLKADGLPTGQGGQIVIKSTSSAPLVIGGTKLTNGVTGTISVGGLQPGQVTITTGGTVTLNSKVTAIGSLTVNGVGAITANNILGSAQTQSVVFNTTNGAITATKANFIANVVGLNTTNAAISATKLMAGEVDFSSGGKTPGAVTLTSASTDPTFVTAFGGSGGTIKIASSGQIESSGQISGGAITITGTSKTGGQINLYDSVSGTGIVTITNAGYVGTNGVSGDLGVKISNKNAGVVVADSASITSSKGTVTISSAGDLSVSSVDSSKSITLTSAGDLKVYGSIGGNIATPTVSLTSKASVTTYLDVSAVKTVAVSAVNHIDVASITAGSGITLATSGKLSTGYVSVSVGSTLKTTATTGKISLSSAGSLGINLLGGIASVSDVTLKAPAGGVTFGAGVSSTAGKITVTGANDIHNSAAISAKGAIAFTSSLGSINVDSDISSATSVALTATKGSITADQAIGGVTATPTVTLTALRGVSVSSITATKAITIKSTGKGMDGTTSVMTGSVVQTTGVGSKIALSGAGDGGVAIDGTVTSQGDLTVTASTGQISTTSGSTLTSAAGKVVLAAVTNIDDQGSIVGQTAVTISATGKSATNTLKVNNITANAGPISIIGAGLLVSDTAGGTISAIGPSTKTKATILIENSNLTNGTVAINGTIGTSGLGGGNVSIAVGAPGTGKNAITSGEISNINVSNQAGTTGTGSVFAGIAPGAIIGPQNTPASLTTIGKVTVVLNSPKAANTITFGDGASVTADPPTVAMTLPALAVNSTLPAVTVAPTQVLSAPALEPVSVPAASPTVTALVAAQSAQFVSFNPAALTQAATSQPFAGLSANRGTGSVDWLGEIENSRGYIPASLTTSGDAAILRKGAMLLAPESDTAVDTIYGAVSVKAKALVLLISFREGLAIYNLHDSGKDSVVAHIGGRTMAIKPCQSAVFVGDHFQYFEEINPAQLVCYSAQNRIRLAGGMQVFHAAFSPPSMINAVPALRNLILSREGRLAKVGADFLKTTSIMMQMRGGFADCKQMLKPEMTAFMP